MQNKANEGYGRVKFA